MAFLQFICHLVICFLSLWFVAFVYPVCLQGQLVVKKHTEGKALDPDLLGKSSAARKGYGTEKVCGVDGNGGWGRK